MAQLLDQCSEVLHNIFRNVEPTDLAALAQTCNSLHDFLQADELLWKTQYLRRFDFPASTVAPAGRDWYTRLSQLIRLDKILRSANMEVKTECLEEVATDAIKMLTSSTSNPELNTAFLADHFSSPANISAFLCRSSLFDRCRYEQDEAAETEELQQLSAKLQVFYGLQVEPSIEHVANGTAVRVHPCARSRVYDLRRLNEGNMWGPFMDDGSQRPDWEKLQAIMIDLGYNLQMYGDRPRRISPSPSSSMTPEICNLWTRPFHGLAPHSFKSSALPGTLTPSENPDLDAQDPYGVTGTWMRIVCFLDYNDLYAFNFESDPISDDQERDPISTREAFRLIRLAIQVTAIEPPGEDDDPSMPVVHFVGKSKSTYMSWDPNANSRIRGTVRTTRGGAIRWTTFSIFHGSERWRSEGIQIGGIRSARGIFGHWFDKDYDEHGPAGPTAFWKVSDDILEEKETPFGLGANAWQEIINLVFEQNSD